MRKFAWLLLALMLVFGGYRVWDRNTQPALLMEPPAVVQTVPAPEPPVVQPPQAPEPPKAGPRPAGKRPPAASPREPRPKAAPAGKKAPVAAPAPAPKAPPPVDKPYPRAASAEAALPVSCATVRWYAKHAPALGQSLADRYHPTAAQLAAAEACLKQK